MKMEGKHSGKDCKKQEEGGGGRVEPTLSRKLKLYTKWRKRHPDV